MNNKKTVIALLLIAIIGIVGLTIAYFANSTSVDNTFITKEYGTTYEETFVSPDNWLPGDTTEKTLVATNTGEVDQAVRVLVTESWTTNNNGTLNGWIHTDGTKSTHITQSELENDERVAILNLANTSDWTKVGNYYYYNYKLAPTESTTSLLESVTFNSKTKLDDTCTTTTNNGVTTTTCNSSGDDYDNATYTLTLTIETVQYNKYASAWNTGSSVTIAEERPIETFAQHIINNANAASITNYTDGITTEAYTFNHEATEQTGALTDYRYIGNNPNNYVYFNCIDESDTSTCETWRIIGVFSVDVGEGNFEQRIKLVKNSVLDNGVAWDSNNINEWSTSSLKEYLNETYINQFPQNFQFMIEDVKFYLGGKQSDTMMHYGSTDEIYNWERGTNVFNPENDRWSCNNTISDSGDCAIRSINWIGKIALMYPSDYAFTYSKGVDSVCYNDPNVCGSTWADPNGDPDTSWIYNSNKKISSTNNEVVWLLNTSPDKPAYYIYDTGSVSDGYGTTGTGNFTARPVLYLKSNTYIVDGNGSSTTPYQIELR